MPAVRRAALTALSLGLISASQHAVAATSAQPAGYLKTFRVDPFEKVILPSNSDLYLGKTVRLNTKQHDAVRINVGYRYIAMLEGGVDATVGGLQQSLPPRAILTRRKASGGRIGELPEGAVILCREPVQRNFGQAMASAATLGITQLAAKYATDVQLCDVDADRDGKIEKLFLGGAKEQQDLEFTSIEPVPYQYRENFEVPDVKLALYAMTRLWGSPIIVAAVEGEGRRSDITSMRFETNGKMVDQKTVIGIKKGQFPQEVKFGSAAFTIKGYDEAAGAVDIEFTKDFDTQKIDWYFAPQTIYIYY